MKFPRACLFLLAVLITALPPQRSTRLSHAQGGQGNNPGCCGPGAQVAPREIDFPYYSLRDGFDSTLLLVSDSTKPVDLTIVLRSLGGHPVFTQATIQPGAKLPLDVRSLLASQGADVTGEFAEGSVAIYFVGTVMPVAGQLTMTNPAQGLIHESEMVENDPAQSDIPPVVNGLWWNMAPGRDAEIMVWNTSGSAVVADVSLDFDGKRHASAPLSFLPNETKVISVTGLLNDLGSSASQAPQGGITIVGRGPKPALIANGKVVDPVSGFSTTLNFMAPDLLITNALHASGVPVGRPSSGSPFAGMGNFTPHVIVRNLLGVPQTVSITVETPSAADVPASDPVADQDGSHSPATTQTMLAPFILAPYSTQDLALDSMMSELAQPLPFCSIRVQYSGAPGSAVAEVSSVDARQDLVIDSRMANEGDGWAGSGAHPCHLDDQTESILFLTDMGDKPARIGSKVQASGVIYYLTKLRLQAHETRAIDLRKLRDAQKPDFLKHVIPAGATDGSIIWQRADNVPVMGRLVVIRRQKGVASNYDCNVCNCPLGFEGYVTLNGGNNATIQVNATESLPALGEYVDPCNETPTYMAVSGNWSSSDTSVATVDSSGNVTGVSGRSATVEVQVSGEGCYWNGQGGSESCQYYPSSGGAGVTVTVQVPATLKVLSVGVLPNGTTGDYGCLTGYDYGIMVDIKYQVLDQGGQAMKSSAMEPHENGTLFGGTAYDNDIGPTRISTTSKYTAADGTFHDAPVGYCTIGVFSGKQATQNITILLNSSSYAVRSQTFTASSSGFGHGSITNGSDISASH